MVDTFRHQGMRKRLVDELRSKGINNELVLQAIADVPRHLFMDNAFLEFAYQDKAFPIEAGQTISQPYTVAYQSQLLLLEKGMKVLEIGTGSGYQTSILYKMGAKVYSIERHKVLNNKAVSLLQELNYNVKLFYGDGFKGLPSFAPFDRILITCGARIVPPELVKQLVIGGILVLPLGPENEQVMTTVIKKDADSYEMMSFDKFKFVPMLENKAP
ncbi:MAG: protein-L-isoaspartate(D-aspartate) O-methyltransferase [Bacteroidia bacterium]|nr:protein-L-isoaspartate(D-aspartate) O-methyltransferase [Bacteroidota bacterium]MBK9045835.1 protein-L-isoaspartate(D-aspartate) O-methyltransferase [Bacteroidota bacterium]MBP9081879.1 protein-L-isoaspartate(D-aspartate) O-methyltransferase [Bacteroidia bacterium]